MEAQPVTITFYGGAESVTGANFLIDFTAVKVGPHRILIDCGMAQGSAIAEKGNWEPFPYDPKSIDVLIITHAHLDHIGRIPKLVRDGFRGKIYSTPPTKDIAEVSMIDSIGVLSKEAHFKKLPPLYEQVDVDNTMKIWETLTYHQPLVVGPATINLRDAGHILGSAMVEFEVNGKKVLFTGDLGNSPAPLLADTEKVTDANYLVMESVYGDRNHPDRNDRLAKFEDVIEETMKNNGTLVIPAFSVERTQEMLFEIERLMEQSRIPLVPVFIDSPLAIKVTAIYKKYRDYFNKNASGFAHLGDGIFKFAQLHFTETTEESKAILRAAPRKIIMAGSGMSNGGRILHHEKAYLSDPKNTLLLVGYQSPGSLGRHIEDGAKSVKIMGEDVQVRARIAMISGYSAHKDSDHLIEFVKATADTLKQVFVVMGEPKSALFLAQRLRDYLGLNATVPIAGAKADILL